MNTERVGKEGEHWLRFLDLDPPKQFFLFISFGYTGFKDFIICFTSCVSSLPLKMKIFTILPKSS